MHACILVESSNWPMLCYINSQSVVLNLRDFTASRGGDESTKIRGDGPCRITGDLPMKNFWI